MKASAPASGGGAFRGVATALALRAAWFAAVLVGAIFAVQLLLWLAPGDAIDLLPNAAELRPVLEREWGLDLSPPARLLHVLRRALAGDLGTSLTVRPGAPVAALVAEAATRSARVLLAALALSVGAGTALAGLTAGWRRAGAARRLVQFLSVPPVFLVAYLLVVGINEATFALVRSGAIARPAWFALPDQPSALRTALAVAVLAFASGSLAEVHAAVEDELRRLRASPFVEAAIARGAAAWPHLAWNLVPPLAALAARRFAHLLGGLVIIEKVLQLNGGGALMWEAALRRDTPLATGLVLAAAAAVCAAGLLADLVRVIVDPRIRGRT